MISRKTLLLLLGLNLAMLLVVAAVLRQDPAPSISTPWKPFPSPTRTGEASLPAQRQLAVPSFPALSSDAPEPADLPATPHAPPTDLSAQTLVPIAFVDPLPEDNLTPADLTNLCLLREQFDQALQEAPHLDPNSPEYYARWRELQDDFDNQFRVEFGDETYLRYQELAARQSRL